MGNFKYVAMCTCYGTDEVDIIGVCDSEDSAVLITKMDMKTKMNQYKRMYKNICDSDTTEEMIDWYKAAIDNVSEYGMEDTYEVGDELYEIRRVLYFE